MTGAAGLDQTLTALADPNRRRAIDLLRERPRRAGELASELTLSPSVMSRHLKVLRDSGLVEESHPEFDARVRVYAIKAGAAANLKAWLQATEQGWSDQLTARKRHPERARR